MDPPDHTRIRKLVNKAFTPRRVAELAPRIRGVVDALLAPLVARDGFDVILDLAAPLPAIVIAELLGVPAEDHRRFKDWSSRLVTLLGNPRPQETLGEFQAAMETLLAYLGGVIAARREQPRDDLISALIHAQEEHDALSDAELLATANLLLVAGHETTTNLIGNGTRALLRHPGELARLRANPALLPSAVEELLRYDSPVQATVRVPTEAVEIGGRTIPKDALVIAGIGAANHDPAVFERPGQLDLGRDPNPHLSFGFGAHFCLGAPLARLEAEIAFGALLERFPRLGLTGEPLRYRPNPVLRGLEALPVRI
jgi:cytochrome P450